MNDFFERMYEAKKTLEAAIIGDRFRVDYQKVSGVPTPNNTTNYYYGTVIGFRAASYYLDMPDCGDFQGRKTHVSFDYCFPISKIEEYLYF